MGIDAIMKLFEEFTALVALRDMLQIFVQSARFCEAMGTALIISYAWRD